MPRICRVPVIAPAILARTAAFCYSDVQFDPICPDVAAPGRVRNFMRSVHFRVDIVSRGKKQSLAAAAAYNAGRRLTDERSGRTHDHSRREDVLVSEVLGPAGMPARLGDLATLVNAIERAEQHPRAQLARSLNFALPAELSLAQNRQLVRDFVREQFTGKGYAAHVAIHRAPAAGDPRNIHAHVIASLRRVERHGFVPTKPEQQEMYRSRRAYVEGLRASWAGHVNRHLERAGQAQRVDHRSYLRQGLDWVAEQHQGPVRMAIKRRLIEAGAWIRKRGRRFLAGDEAETDRPSRAHAAVKAMAQAVTYRGCFAEVAAQRYAQTLSAGEDERPAQKQKQRMRLKS
jgi:ATP-dependent exoDNAse (exonuclease V) alpha subunit